MTLFSCNVYFVLYRQSVRPLICSVFKKPLFIYYFFSSLFLLCLPDVLYLPSKALHGLIHCKEVFVFYWRGERRHARRINTPLIFSSVHLL